MMKVRWGIIGPGKIANRFAEGLSETHFGDLVAIASKSNKRRKTFGDKYNIINSLRFDNYEEILQCSEIDAIYISTPHTLHREWSIKAAINGKHILCEKPACINYEEGKKVINEVKNAGVFFMEGFMYRCHPQIQELLNIVKSNIVGRINLIKSSFGFNAGEIDPNSRLFNIDLAGGAILDVGLYPISFSRLIAGTISGLTFMNPKSIKGNAIIGETGVDETAHATLCFENEVKAEVSTSITKDMKNIAVLEGEKGKIILNNPWQPGKEGGPYRSLISIETEEKKENIEMKGKEHLFFFEAEFASKYIIEKRTQALPPAMTWEDTLGNLQALDSWRNEVGYKLPQDII